MRKGLLGAVAAMAFGAGTAWSQGRPAMQPQPMMPGGAYGGPVMPAQFAPGPEAMPGPAGGPMMDAPMPGGPMFDPFGGMGGMPTYPPQGGFEGDCFGGGSGFVPHWWVNAEYLLWFTRSQPVRQPYVTTSAPGDFGVLGQPTTQILSSPSDQSYGLFSGFRIMGGWYKDADRRCGYELGGFLSEDKTNIFTATSDPNGIPVLARTFNLAGGGNGVFIVSNLGQAAGGVSVSTNSRFWGAEGSIVSNLYRSCPDAKCFWNTDLLFGFRFFQLQEDLNFASNSQIIGGGATFVGQPVAAGGRIVVVDTFDSSNDFYGGQVGIRSNINYGRCNIALTGKIAFGLMHEVMDVRGTTSLVDAALGINATANGGIFATSQNIGKYKNDEFAVIPEVGMNLGYQWCSWLSSYVGYNFMYVSRVARPGDALPIGTNPALMPSSNNFGIGAVTAVPNTTISQSDFWIQGVTFGFNVRY